MPWGFVPAPLQMDRFKNKFRSPSARAQWWDYSSNGLYYITACTAGRECTLGRIKNDEMFASPVGTIVLEEWYKSFEIRKELSCDIFQMMPNHLHAILRIERVEAGTHESSTTRAEAALQAHNPAATPHNETINPDRMSEAIHATGVAYRPPKSISSFMAGFKSSATKKINEYRKTPKLPVWQSRFHDHVIRNFDEYRAIYFYILNNVRRWKDDQLHP